MILNRLKKIQVYLPPGVNILAVSKGYPSTSLVDLADFGQVDFGESRLQEALLKLEALRSTYNLCWHFIGRLQTNKVRSVVRNFQFIHSVDSLRLASRISRIAQEENRTPKIMLQVKFLEDSAKTGMSPERLIEDWQEFWQLPHIKISGLMTIAPLGVGSNARKTIFKDCRSLADNLHLKDCSMGMSGDWKEAVDAGSTWLRLGSALFGAR